MCEWMIKFSVLGKLLPRQKQNVLLPLLHCAHCDKYRKGGDHLKTNKCQSPSVSYKIHYVNYNSNVTKWLAQVTLYLSFLNTARERGEGWRMIWVSQCTFYFYQRPASADCTQTNKLLHLSRNMIEKSMLYKTFREMFT